MIYDREVKALAKLETLSVREAALCACNQSYWDDYRVPDGYNAIVRHIINGINSSIIIGNLINKSNHVDENMSNVNVVSLVRYFIDRGIYNKYMDFYDNPLVYYNDYLFLDVNESEKINIIELINNKKGDYYAPKLAAALNAWLEVQKNDPPDIKRALKEWFTEHAEEYEIEDKEGVNSKKGAIEQCARIANWKWKGGANKSKVKRQPLASSKIKGDSVSKLT